MGEPDFVERPILCVHWDALHGVQRRVDAVDDLDMPVLAPAQLRRCGTAYLAKDGIFAVKMRLFGVGCKELGFVGVGTRICHGKNSTVIELRLDGKIGG